MTPWRFLLFTFSALVLIAPVLYATLSWFQIKGFRKTIDPPRMHIRESLLYKIVILLYKIVIKILNTKLFKPSVQFIVAYLLACAGSSLWLGLVTYFDARDEGMRLFDVILGFPHVYPNIVYYSLLSVVAPLIALLSFFAKNRIARQIRFKNIWLDTLVYGTILGIILFVIGIPWTLIIENLSNDYFTLWFLLNLVLWVILFLLIIRAMEPLVASSKE